MDEGYQIVYTEAPEWDIIGGGINDYNQQHAGVENGKRLCFVLKGPDQTVLGGVIGITYWDWLYIDLMWLPEEVRGRGYGQRLLALAEPAEGGRLPLRSHPPLQPLPAARQQGVADRHRASPRRR